MNNQISSNSKEDPDNKSESSGSSEEDDKEIPIDLNEVESDSDQDDEKSDEDKKDKQLSDSDELIGSESDENVSQIPFGNQDSEDSDSSGLELKKVDLTDQNNNKRQQFDLISDWQQKEKQRQEMLALKVMQQVKEKRREAELQEQIKLGKVNERNLLVPLDKNQGIQLLMSGIDETNKVIQPTNETEQQQLLKQQQLQLQLLQQQLLELQKQQTDQIQTENTKSPESRFYKDHNSEQKSKTDENKNFSLSQASQSAKSSSSEDIINDGFQQTLTKSQLRNFQKQKQQDQQSNNNQLNLNQNEKINLKSAPFALPQKSEDVNEDNQLNEKFQILTEEKNQLLLEIWNKETLLMRLEALQKQRNAENNQLSYLIMTERQETKKREFYRGNQMRILKQQWEQANRDKLNLQQQVDKLLKQVRKYKRKSGKRKIQIQEMLEQKQKNGQSIKKEEKYENKTDYDDETSSDESDQEQYNNKQSDMKIGPININSKEYNNNMSNNKIQQEITNYQSQLQQLNNENIQLKEKMKEIVFVKANLNLLESENEEKQQEIIKLKKQIEILTKYKDEFSKAKDEDQSLNKQTIEKLQQQNKNLQLQNKQRKVQFNKLLHMKNNKEKEYQHSISQMSNQFMERVQQIEIYMQKKKEKEFDELKDKIKVLDDELKEYKQNPADHLKEIETEEQLKEQEQKLQIQRAINSEIKYNSIMKKQQIKQETPKKKTIENDKEPESQIEEEKEPERKIFKYDYILDEDNDYDTPENRLLQKQLDQMRELKPVFTSAEELEREKQRIKDLEKEIKYRMEIEKLKKKNKEIDKQMKKDKEDEKKKSKELIEEKKELIEKNSRLEAEIERIKEKEKKLIIKLNEVLLKLEKKEEQEQNKDENIQQIKQFLQENDEIEIQKQKQEEEALIKEKLKEEQKQIKLREIEEKHKQEMNQMVSLIDMMKLQLNEQKEGYERWKNWNKRKMEQQKQSEGGEQQQQKQQDDVNIDNKQQAANKKQSEFMFLNPDLLGLPQRINSSSSFQSTDSMKDSEKINNVLDKDMINQQIQLQLQIHLVQQQIEKQKRKQEMRIQKEQLRQKRKEQELERIKNEEQNKNNEKSEDKQNENYEEQEQEKDEDEENEITFFEPPGSISPKIRRASPLMNRKLNNTTLSTNDIGKYNDLLSFSRRMTSPQNDTKLEDSQQQKQYDSLRTMNRTQLAISPRDSPRSQAKQPSNLVINTNMQYQSNAHLSTSPRTPKQNNNQKTLPSIQLQTPQTSNLSYARIASDQSIISDNHDYSSSHSSLNQSPSQMHTPASVDSFTQQLTPKAIKNQSPTFKASNTSIFNKFIKKPKNFRNIVKQQQGHVEYQKETEKFDENLNKKEKNIKKKNMNIDEQIENMDEDDNNASINILNNKKKQKKMKNKETSDLKLEKINQIPNKTDGVQQNSHQQVKIPEVEQTFQPSVLQSQQISSNINTQIPQSLLSEQASLTSKQTQSDSPSSPDQLAIPQKETISQQLNKSRILSMTNQLYLPPPIQDQSKFHFTNMGVIVDQDEMNEKLKEKNMAQNQSQSLKNDTNAPSNDEFFTPNNELLFSNPAQIKSDQLMIPLSKSDLQLNSNQNYQSSSIQQDNTIQLNEKIPLKSDSSEKLDQEQKLKKNDLKINTTNSKVEHDENFKSKNEVQNQLQYSPYQKVQQAQQKQINKQQSQLQKLLKISTKLKQKHTTKLHHLDSNQSQSPMNLSQTINSIGSQNSISSLNSFDEIDDYKIVDNNIEEKVKKKKKKKKKAALY